jgi:LPS sulfotransferase NodH
VVLAFTNRAGSNHLAEYLCQTGRLAGFEEVLNHDTVAHLAEQWHCRSLPDYIARHVARQTPRGGRWWGVKASAEQLAMLARARIPAMFPALRVVHIWRRDILAQAVSLDIAWQSGRWTSLQQATTGREPVLDIGRIERTIEAIQTSNAAILSLAAALDLPLVSVCHEDLLARPQAVIAELGRGIGLDLSGWQPQPTRLSPQADATNARFIAEFRRRATAALGQW